MAGEVRNILDAQGARTLRRLCFHRNLPSGGNLDDKRSRIARSYRGEVAELIKFLRRGEMIKALEFFEFELDGESGGFRGQRSASRPDLEKTMMKIFVDQWEPGQRRQPFNEGFPIRIAWTSDADEEVDEPALDDDEDDEESDASDGDTGESDAEEAAFREWVSGLIGARGSTTIMIKTLVAKLGRHQAKRRLRTLAVREVGRVLASTGFETDPDLVDVDTSPGIDARVRVSRIDATSRTRATVLRDAPEPKHEPAAVVLQRLLGPSLLIEKNSDAWPIKGTLLIAQREISVDLFARVVGGSARGNALERRFQNPSQGSPIVEAAGRQALLLGLWVERGDERAVIVAFDAHRRTNRNTRFSVFMPLALLEEAADTGYATHANLKGEMIHAFRPENLARYLQQLLESSPSRGVVAVESRGVPSNDANRPDTSLDPAETSRIYIRPRVGMYAAFARLNYKPWFALAEFVDNSIQSFLHNRERLVAAGHDGPLTIDIGLDDTQLSVTDRAAGIAWSSFPRAFSPAAPPDDTTGLSEFGLGMKAAASWFSKRWTVRTSALGEPVERTVTFDIPKISQEGLEHLPIESRPARETDHFTVVTMQDLRVRPRGATLKKIKDHLASIYRLLIQDGVVRLRVTASGKTEELQCYHPRAAHCRSPPYTGWPRTFVAAGVHTRPA